MSWLKDRRERKAREAEDEAARVEAERQAKADAERREAEAAEERRALLERVEGAKVSIVTAGSLMKSTVDRVDRRIKAIASAASAATSGEFTLNGVQLVEPRIDNSLAKLQTQLLSAKGFKGVTLPKREAMTVIDQSGSFSLRGDHAVFVGGQQTRKWEFRKLTGYLTTDENELIIGVSNRQKMSGIRYPATYDDLVDSVFEAVYLRWKDHPDVDEIRTAADSEVAALRSERAAAKEAACTEAQAAANKLLDLGVPPHEVQELADDSGFTMTITRSETASPDDQLSEPEVAPSSGDTT